MIDNNSNPVPDWVTDSTFSLPTAYEWLESMGGLAPAAIAEEEYHSNDLSKVAHTEVIGETLHWVLNDEP